MVSLFLGGENMELIIKVSKDKRLGDLEEILNLIKANSIGCFKGGYLSWVKGTYCEYSFEFTTKIDGAMLNGLMKLNGVVGYDIYLYEEVNKDGLYSKI
jgi:hypothetical protein